MNKRECKNCHNKIPEHKRPNAHFCSQICYGQYQTKILKRTGEILPPATVGAVNELLACVDLYSKGFNVFRSLSPSCPCDLIVSFKDILTRIEVRSGKLVKNGKIQFTSSKKADIIAVVLQTKQIFYFNPDICALEDKLKKQDLFKILKGKYYNE